MNSISTLFASRRHRSLGALALTAALGTLTPMSAAQTSAMSLDLRAQKTTNFTCDDNQSAAICRGTTSTGKTRYFIAYVTDGILRLEKRAENDLKVKTNMMWDDADGQFFSGMTNLNIFQSNPGGHVVVTFLWDDGVWMARFSADLEYMGYSTVTFGTTGDYRVHHQSLSENASGEYLVTISENTPWGEHGMVQHRVEWYSGMDDARVIEIVGNNALGRTYMAVEPLQLELRNLDQYAEPFVLATSGSGGNLKISLAEVNGANFEVHDEARGRTSNKVRLAAIDLDTSDRNQDQFVSVSRRSNKSLDIDTWDANIGFSGGLTFDPIHGSNLRGPFAANYDVGRLSDNKMLIAAIDRNTDKAKTMLFRIKDDGYPLRKDVRFTTGPFDMALIASEGPTTTSATMHRYSGGGNEGRLLISVWDVD